MAELPSGTVTFLFTDIEGSTARWEGAPEAMRVALARHDALIRAAIVEHHGHVVKTTGDGFHTAFARAPDALAAAIDAQRRLQAEPWGEIGSLLVRMAVHTGAAEERDGDYYGPALNRAARLLSTGYGGQVLLSETTYDLVRDEPPVGASLDDLGEHRLKDLVRPERVFQLTCPELPTRFPPLRTLDARPHNLPTHPTALLGRERELADVRELFEDGARLVTLTGPGGTGKTRLGLQVGADLLDDFQDGVFLVDLAPISDPALVPSTIAQVLRVPEVGGRAILETVKDYLGSKSLLLLVDNFEQIISAAPLVADLLAACPGLKALVTSREPLRLRGEREYEVPPLALPDPRSTPTPDTLARYAAASLFLERAAEVRADFVATTENAPAIGEICTRLDGLPLAIELAAARVRLLTPYAIVGRLGRRLPLLTGGARDLPTRQQTLRSTIAWSYDLLDDRERRLFRRLAAFIGGWTLEAAHAVCDLGDLDVLDDLGSLAAKSLIRRSEGPDGEPRFGMLETIREYSLERLDESREAARVRRRHARYYLAVAEVAEANLRAGEQGSWLNRLAAEHGNMRAALQLLVEEGEGEMGLRLGGALAHFWEVRGYHTEGRARLAAVLQLVGTRADPKLRAKVLCEFGFLAADQGDYAGARVLQEESLAVMRKLGDRRGIARCLTGLAWIAIDQGQHAAGRALHLESLAIARDLGDRRGIALGLQGLGRVAAIEGDRTAARSYDEESLAIVRDLGDVRNIARLLIALGWVAVDQQDPAGARERLAEGLAIADELGDLRSLIDGIEACAHLAVARGTMDRAARLRGAAEARREAIGAPYSPTERAEDEIDIAAIRAALGEPKFARAWAEGRAMTLDQAVAYALDEPPPA